MDTPPTPDRPDRFELAPDLLRPMVTHWESEVMYLVSPTHDILMLNAGFEAIWQRPASTFLGKKCYREIEKRSAPCPHCPGVIALRTGKVTEAEAYATLDDGTRIPFLLRAYPLYGVNGEPAGFVETAEDISERRRFEDDARHEVSLVNDLLTTSSTTRVLKLGLDAALRLDGVDSGCVHAVDPHTGARELVAQRGQMTSEIESTDPTTDNSASSGPQGDSPLVKVPIMVNGERCAELTVRLSGDVHLWSSSRSKVEALASMLASALARIREERLRGDAVMNAQTIVSTVPLAAFFLDGRGRVTVWNEAAERAFGWSAQDTLQHSPPIVVGGQEERFLTLVAEAASTSQSSPFSFRCTNRQGVTSDVWFRAAAVRDVIGDGSSYLVIGAEDAGTEAVESYPAPVTDAGDLAETQGIGELLQSISRVMIAAQNPKSGTVSSDPGSAGNVGAGRMSVSWDESGAIDIHVSLPSSEDRLSEDLALPRALVIQSNQEDAERLGRILDASGYSVRICDSVSGAVEHVRLSRDRDQPPQLAIVDMVMPDGPNGVETARLLMALVPELRVVVSSDRGVIGHTAHGFAAAISRPYSDDKVRSAVTAAVGQRAS